MHFFTFVMASNQHTVLCNETRFIVWLNSFWGHFIAFCKHRSQNTRKWLKKRKAYFSKCALEYDFAPSFGSGPSKKSKLLFSNVRARNIRYILTSNLPHLKKYRIVQYNRAFCNTQFSPTSL
jgi:hypothetical protein